MSPAAAGSASANTKVRGNDYGYTNARLRGMRARLLKREALERLLLAGDLHHAIQELTQTEYAPDLEAALIHGRSAHEVDDALRMNLVRTYQKVLGFLGEEALDICGTLLGRWDAFNLKTILRGKHVHLDAKEIREGLLPVGALGQSELEALAGLADIREVVALAGTWGLPQAPAMRRGLVRYQETGELADLELALDRYYAQWAMQRLSKRKANYQRARKVLGMQVDVLNLVIVFRAARENLPYDQSVDYFLEGGAEIKLDRYQRLAAMSDVDQILDDLRGTQYGKTVDEAALRYLETTSLASFERALEDYLTRKVLALGSSDPLGIGIPIAYLWAKQNEVTNLRIIVKSLSVGIPPERARRELILV